MTRIVILDGHPDPDPARFVHALARAYAEGAEDAGHEVRRVEIAAIDFPLLRAQHEWMEGALPPGLAESQAAVGWADHLVILYPLWLGDVPALLKGFLEQVVRPGFAFRYRKDGFPEKLLAGKSARVVVTMGMPAIAYRWFYRAHSLKSLERNVLKFVGIAPVRTSVLGGVAGSAEKRAGWIEDMRRLGHDAF